MLFGAHESVAGGVSSAFGRAKIDGCHAIQVFTKNSNQWKEPVISPEGVTAFREGRAAYGEAVSILAHASYLINLGTDDALILQRSVDALVAEVERSSALGIDYVVLHPGAHLGAGEEVGLSRVCEALDAVHERTPGATARVLLENTAGQGTCVGHRFEHLQAIFEGTKGSVARGMGVCFDTQHAFAAGYDLSSDEGYEKTFAQLDRCVGLGRLRAFHLNDSKKPLGARVDRHEHLGDGEIGLRAFWRLANDRRFESTPAVLETEPREGGEPFKVEVALLTGLVGAKPPEPKPVFALEVVEAKPAKAGRAGKAQAERSRRG
jgi:deoxyribonuclease-4